MDINFKIGSLYSRKEIGDICYPGVGRPPGGNWDTGYVSVENNLIVFMNIGVPGRTGHNFNNSFDKSSKTIIWFGKRKTHSRQPTFQKLLHGELTPHFFARWDQKSKFTYLGIANVLDFEDNAQINEGTAIKIKLQVQKKNNHHKTDKETNRTNQLESLGFGSSIILNKDITEIELSVRAINCLSYAKIKKIADLIVLNEFELMMFPGFGGKTLREIQDLLATYGLSLGTPRKKVKQQLSRSRSQSQISKSLDHVSTEIRINNTAYLDKISSNDKRFLFGFLPKHSEDGEFISLKDYLLDLLTFTNRQEEIDSFLDNFDEAIEAYLSLSIFDQLAYILYFFSSTKTNEYQRKAFIGRFSFNGQKRLTLEASSKLFKPTVTRERVRQIESKFIGELRSSSTHTSIGVGGAKKYYLPKLDKLLQHLKGILPIPLDHIEKIKLSENRDEFMTYDGLKTICDIYDYPLPFKVVKKRGSSFIVLDKSESSLLEETLNTLTRACRSFGMVHFDDAFQYLEKKTEITIERDKLMSLIDESYLVSLGDDWFFDPIGSYKTNRFYNTLQKMFFCHPVIEIGEIREGFHRVIRRRPVGIATEWEFSLPPKRIMIRYIEQHDSYDIDSNQNVTSNSKIEQSDLDNYGNENLFTMLSIIKGKKSGLIDRETLRKEAELRGVNSNSLQVELTYAPWLKQFGHSIWGIRGSHPKDLDIEILGYERRLKQSQRKRNLYQHDEMGQLVVTSTIYDPGTYVLTIPTADKKSVGPKNYDLIDINGRNYGTGRNSSGLFFVGLPKALARMHIEDDDLVKFSFNYEKKELLIVPIVDDHK